MILDQSFREALARTNVLSFSMHVFGVQYSELEKLLYPRPSYRAFLIPKKDGGLRAIHSPRLHLKIIQKKLLEYLERVGNPPKASAHGFCKDRSIVTNAAKHSLARTRFILNIDLENFFPSINFFRVRGLLLAPPFGLSYPVASLVAHICTYQNELPQGAPTSPYISNQIARSLDRDLMNLAMRHRATYTRYVDDITFSFSVRSEAALPANICSFDSGILSLGAELQALIAKNGFKLNEKKSRISSSRRRMEVTGLKINRFPNVRRNFIDEIRGALKACETHGYLNADAHWKRSFRSDFGVKRANTYRALRDDKYQPELKDFLRGKILFVKMVRGEDDLIYNRLAERFNAVMPSTTVRPLKVYPVVKTEDDLRRACFVIYWQAAIMDTASGERKMLSGQGTGFLYGDGNLITCDHIFYDTTALEGVQKDVHITDRELEDIKCVAIDHQHMEHDLTLMRWDVPRDLALLHFDRNAPHNKHLTPALSSAKRHDRGWLAGYPDWTSGRPANVVEAQVDNSYVRSGLARLELNQTIRSGYSGGPYVDKSYRLIGIAHRGATQSSGTNECLASHELDKWIASP